MDMGRFWWFSGSSGDRAASATDVNRLEVNATINLLRERGLLPADHTAPLAVNDLIAHVYDACARNGVTEGGLRREVESLRREHLPEAGNPPSPPA